MKLLASYPALKIISTEERELASNQFAQLVVSISNNLALGVLGGDKEYWGKMEELANTKIDEYFISLMNHIPIDHLIPKIPYSYLKQSVIAQIINSIIDPPSLYTDDDWFGLGYLYEETLNYIDRINELLNPIEKIEFTKDISPLLIQLGYSIKEHYPKEHIYEDSQREISISTLALSVWRRSKRLGLEPKDYLDIEPSHIEQFIDEILSFYSDENYEEVCEVLTQCNLATKDQIEIFVKLKDCKPLQLSVLVDILNDLPLNASINEVIYPKDIKLEDTFLDKLFRFLPDMPINSRTNWLLLQLAITHRPDRSFDLILNTIKSKRTSDFWSGSEVIRSSQLLRMKQIFPCFVNVSFFNENIMKILEIDEGLNCISTIIEKAPSFLNDILILLEDIDKEELGIENFLNPDLLIYAINTGLTSFKMFSILYGMTDDNREKFAKVIREMNNNILRKGINSLDVSVESFWKKIEGFVNPPII